MNCELVLKNPERGLFVTGTDTEVGKTYVSSLIVKSLVARGHRVGVYKPVASGCQRVGRVLHCDDANSLWLAAEKPCELDKVCPQCFEAPLAPSVAASVEGKSVDCELLRSGLEFWTDHCDVVVVEGVGGLMSPVSDEDYVADLAYEFGYPLVVVAPNQLGVINQTLQTLITAATYCDGIMVAGVVLNNNKAPSAPDDPSIATNLLELKKHCVPPVLDHCGWQSQRVDSNIDWFQLAARQTK